jgi:large subunit ribosomal protein L32
MAHPKRKISKTRRDKRRTHSYCSTDCYSEHEEAHLYHRAYWHEGKCTTEGNVIDKSVAVV